MYIAIFTFIIVEFQKYVMENFEEIKPNLARSHLSNIIEKNIFGK